MVSETRNIRLMKGKTAMTWFLLGVVLVVLLAAAYFSLRGRGDTPAQVSVPEVKPDPRNDKVIVVEGWNDAEIRKVISDFIRTYEDEGYPAYTIEPHKQSENLYRLSFPQDIHPQLFTFLVNYIAYPFDLDLTNRFIIVAGQTTLSPAFEGVGASLAGQKAILYIPENDEDHDVVYLRTESGVHLANSFTDVKWKTVNDARLSNQVKNLVAGH